MTRLLAGGFVVVILLETLAFLVDPPMALPAAGIAAAGFVVVATGRLAVAGAGAPAGAPGPEAGESLRRWRAQTEASIAWADGTRGDWDRHLRPRLAREFMLATGRVATRAEDRDSLRETGRMVFGEDLWPWVDASDVRRSGRDEPGPGRAALEEILRRLEQL